MRVAVAGFGAVCENAHLPALKKLGFDIAGVFDISEKRREDALSYGFSVYDNAERMIDETKPDFVLISTPPYSHKAIIDIALRRNVNVVCEKPLCLNMKEFFEIKSLSEKYNRIVFTVHNWKYAPAVSEMFEICSRISPIRYLSWYTLRKSPSITVSSQWRLDPSKSGGGIIFDHGWHVIYIVKNMLNSQSINLSPHFVFNDSKIDEMVDLRLHFANGSIADIHLSWRSPVRKNFVLCYGEKGWFEFNDDVIVYEDISGSSKIVFDEKISASSAHAQWTEKMYLEFLKAVENKEYALKNLEESYECIKVIELSYNISKGV